MVKANRVLVFLALALLPMAALAGAGLTPSGAIPLTADETEGATSRSIYYSFTAEEEGILTVTARAVSGEIDLAVSHFSGSPSSESRHEGMQAEEVSLKARKGDRFLIRVISPLGAKALFRVKAGVETPRTARPLDVFVPETDRTGVTEADAVEIPFGKIVPVEAYGERFFKTSVPPGFVLAVSVYPVRGDVDLEASVHSSSKTLTSASTQRGSVSEHLFLPVSEISDVSFRVMPATPPVAGALHKPFTRYAVVLRLRHPGIALAATEEPDDPAAVAAVFPQEGTGRGIPGAVLGAAEAGRAGKTPLLRLR